MLIIKCSYCPIILGTKEGGEGITHGICPKCMKEQNKKLEEWLKEQKESKKNDK